jgi:hypothetical protein
MSPEETGCGVKEGYGGGSELWKHWKVTGIAAFACLSIGIHDGDGVLNSLNLVCESVFIERVIGTWCCVL